MVRFVAIQGVSIPSITKKEFIETVRFFWNGNKARFVLPISSRYLVLAATDIEYKKALLKANLLYPDGIGLKIGAHFLSKPATRVKLPKTLVLGFELFLKFSLFALFVPKKLTTIPESINFTDTIWDVLHYASFDKKRVYFLGSDFLEKTDEKKTLEKAVSSIRKSMPDLIIAGYTRGFGIHDFTLENDSLVKEINACAPDILIAGFMDSYEARWLEANYLKIPSLKLAIGVGGSFDFIAGNRKRCPEPLRKNLEWLWRLAQDPWRIGRIWKATVSFFTLVYIEKIKKP